MIFVAFISPRAVPGVLIWGFLIWHSHHLTLPLPFKASSAQLLPGVLLPCLVPPNPVPANFPERATFLLQHSWGRKPCFLTRLPFLRKGAPCEAGGGGSALMHPLAPKARAEKLSRPKTDSQTNLISWSFSTTLA